MPDTDTTDVRDDRDVALDRLRQIRDELADVRGRMDQARDARDSAITDARTAGLTLDEIGQALGLSKQRVSDLS